MGQGEQRYKPRVALSPKSAWHLNLIYYDSIHTPGNATTPAFRGSFHPKT